MTSIVIIGAGFSKHFANIPIVSEINRTVGSLLVTDEKHVNLVALAPKRRDDESLENWLSRLAEPDIWISRNERTLSYLLMQEINSHVARLIFDSQSNAIAYDSDPTERPPADLVKLTTHWLNGGCDCIISLNYDTLIERTVNHIKNNDTGYRILHPFQIPFWAEGRNSTGDLDLLKLHGSTNIWASPSDPTRVIDVGVQNAGCDAGQIPWWDHLFHHAPGFEPLVVPPIAAKTSVLESTFLKYYWEMAGRHIKLADEIVLIGYSLPPEDMMLGRLLRTNTSAGYVIVNRTVAPIAENVRSLGGNNITEFDSDTAIPDYIDYLENNS